MKGLIFSVIISILTAINSFALGAVSFNDLQSADSLPCSNLVEVRGFVTTNESYREPSIRMPAEGVFVVIFNQKDYLNSIDSIDINKPIEIASYWTKSTGMFSFKLPKGRYLIHVDYDNNSITDPRYILVDVDGTKQVVDIGEVKLRPLVIVSRTGEDIKSVYGTKRVRELTGKVLSYSSNSNLSYGIGALVSIYNTKDQDRVVDYGAAEPISTMYSNSDGSFAILLPKGRYFIKFNGMDGGILYKSVRLKRGDVELGDVELKEMGYDEREDENSVK